MVMTSRTSVVSLFVVFMACVFVLSLAPGTAYGFNSIRNACVTFYTPSGGGTSDCQRVIDSLEDAGGSSCQVCHVGANGGQPWNGYGFTLYLSGIDFAAADVIDSDGSGFTNGEEIQFNPTGPYGAQPGWAVEPAPFPPGNVACTDPDNDPTNGNESCVPTTQIPAVAGLYDPVGALCGNGIIEPGEQCDDSNTLDGDCCDSFCMFEPPASPCPDGMFCNGDEACDGEGSCVAGNPVDCTDQVGCTDDSCNEATDSCDNIANDANCPDDGMFCNGAEFCDLVTDCTSTGDPCPPGEACNEETDVCETAQACGNGVMEPGEDCDDGNLLDGDCCSANCTFEPAGSPCPDGVFCNGAESCDGAGSCSLAISACPPGKNGCIDVNAVCDEDNDTCIDVPNDAECDNLDFCDGVETCDSVSGLCLPGLAVDCSDGVGCTDDSCNEGTDSCDNIANDANCPDDGMFCNGAEFCDLVTDCTSTGDPCPPGEACNEETDVCEPAVACGDGILDPGEDCDDGNLLDGDCCSALCTFEPAGSSCADGDFCNGDETCDGAGICVAGTDVDCSDGVSCTIDSCDEINDVCVNTTDDNLCPDDGLFCTGQEVCDQLLDCVSTGDPCLPGDACNEESNICEPVTTGKVTICHIPPGNPGNAKTKVIGAESVADHLGHGDTLGPCDGTNG